MTTPLHPYQRSPVKFSSMSDIRIPLTQDSQGEVSLPSPAASVGFAVSSNRGSMATPSSPQSLPSHLQDLVVIKPSQAPSVTRSKDSLSLSRTSAGNSIETVISVHRLEEREENWDTEEEVSAVKRSQEMEGGGRGGGGGREGEGEGRRVRRGGGSAQSSVVKYWIYAIQSNTVQYSAIQCNTVQYSAIQCNTL